MSLRMVGLAIGLPIFLAAFTVPIEEPANALWLTTPFNSDGCSECHGCGVNKIYFTSNGDDVLGNLQGTGCWPNDCDDLIECPPQFASSASKKLFLDVLHEALQTADADAIAAIVREHSDWVTVNVRREALQIKGCSDQITAHLPVSKEVVAALIAE
jgi:hypothetical protein